MKIQVRITERCLVIMAGAESTLYTSQFYMLFDELETVIANGGYGTFSDCGEICMIHSEQLIFIENASTKNDFEGTVRYLRIPMDCLKFFSRMKDLRDRGLIGEKFVTLDTKSFRLRTEPVRVMTFTEILRHEYFDAKDKLYEAMRTVPREQMFKLREDISRMLDRGKRIVADGCVASFYFYQAVGEGYNGGIIYHQHSKSYSVHT